MNQPDIMFPIEAATTITQTQVRARQPSRRSRRNDCGGSGTCTGSRSSERKKALTPKLAASTAIAQPGPTPATSAPPIAGPTIPADAIEMPRSAFACCSRSALTVSGVNPVEAGLKKADAEPATAWRTAICQMRAECVRSSTATAPWLPRRTRSAVSMTARRGSRSAKTPPTSRNATSGAVFAAITQPRSETEPVRSRTANASAIVTIWSPSSETICPVKRSRNSRSRSASRLLARGRIAAD